MIKLSVITINYNNKSGLEKTIQSVIGQEELDFEYIVIDGGSNDGSKEIIERYQEKITYWVSEKDTGIYHAQNKGIKAASGKFLLFLNSGDYLYTNTVLKNVIAELDDTAIIYGDIIMKSDNGKEKTEILPEHMDAFHLMVSTIWHPGAFIQKKVFENFGYYDESFKIAADYAFFVKNILIHKLTTKHLRLIISVFEMNGVSTDPKHFDAMLQERKRIQVMYFTNDQLMQLARIEINQAGRNSRYFKFLPNSPLIQKMFDKFYYYWYNRRMN